MATKIGLEMKLYRNNGGTWATPTWQEITKTKDLSLNVDISEADVSDRGSFWRKIRGALISAAIEFGLNYDPANTHVTALQTASIASTLTNRTVLIAVADGDIATSGTLYWKFDSEIFNFSRDEGLESGVMVNVTMKPTESANVPTIVTVA